MDVSVIIVNYNGKHHLKRCLDSLSLNLTGVKSELIIVDNASVDGSVEYIRDRFPWVKLLVSDINTGFTGGNNIAAKEAIGKYLLLLNNDTVVESPLSPMLEVFEKNPDVGVVGCMLQYGNGQLQESVGYEHTPVSLPLSWVGLGGVFTKCKFLRRTAHHSSEVYTKSFVECAWVSGACLMTRSDVWKTIGGFDEAYFMYVEDVDYCRSVSLLGYKIAYIKNVLVTHYEGGGRVWIGERALLNTIRSYRTFSEKNFSVNEDRIMRFSLAAVFIFRSFIYWLRYLVTKNNVIKEKHIAYFHGARDIF